MELSSQRIGIAGELRVMSELLLKGHNPAKSYLDDGIDIILESGIRIQVKTASRTHFYTKGGFRYIFSLTRRRYKKEKPRQFDLGVSDFLICWGIEDNVFYIIPSNLIEPKVSLTLSTNEKHKDNKYSNFKNRWDLLNLEM